MRLKQVPEALIHRAMWQPALREAVYRYVDWRDQWRLSTTELQNVPPASLRFRVHGDLDISSFLETGKQCSEDIKDALTKVSANFESFRDVLDFGCGCGRTIRWLQNSANSASLYGTDIDATAINWCRRHLEFAGFETNRPRPPLTYAANRFDFVYAISVFTHLTEEDQLCWLSELRRVTRPSGHVLLTVRGSYYWNRMSPTQLDQVKKAGFVFSETAKFMQGIFPEWYQDAYHSQEYIVAEYSKYFEVVEYIPHGLDGCQDIVLLRKR